MIIYQCFFNLHGCTFNNDVKLTQRAIGNILICKLLGRQKQQIIFDKSIFSKLIIQNSVFLNKLEVAGYWFISCGKVASFYYKKNICHMISRYIPNLRRK